jgi:hypothetical protein
MISCREAQTAKTNISRGVKARQRCRVSVPFFDRTLHTGFPAMRSQKGRAVGIQFVIATC